MIKGKCRNAKWWAISCRTTAVEFVCLHQQQSVISMVAIWRCFIAMMIQPYYVTLLRGALVTTDPAPGRKLCTMFSVTTWLGHLRRRAVCVPKRDDNASSCGAFPGPVFAIKIGRRWKPEESQIWLEFQSRKRIKNWNSIWSLLLLRLLSAVLDMLYSYF